MSKKNQSRYGEQTADGRAVYIIFRVTTAERATINRVAKARGVTAAMLVRSGLTSMGVPGLRVTGGGA